MAALVGLWGSRAGAGTVTRAFEDVPGVMQRVAVERYCTGGHGTLTALREPDGGGTRGTILTRQGAYVADVAGPLRDPGDGTDEAREARWDSPTPSLTNWHDPMGLVRSQGPTGTGWRSRSAVLPQQVGYALGREVVLDRVSFWHTRRSPPETWARDVALLVGTAAPDREFRLAGRWTLARTTDPQTFSFVAVSARCVRLCLQSRQDDGDADFVSLGGFALGVLTGTVVPDSRPPGPLPPGSIRSVG